MHPLKCVVVSAVDRVEIVDAVRRVASVRVFCTGSYQKVSRIADSPYNIPLVLQQVDRQLSDLVPVVNA